MNYNKNDTIEFNIYGTTVVGSFVKIENDKITIKVTKDFIKENIGKEQTIHKSHRHIIIN